MDYIRACLRNFFYEKPWFSLFIKYSSERRTGSHTHNARDIESRARDTIHTHIHNDSPCSISPYRMHVRDTYAMRLIFEGKHIEQANARNIINSSGAQLSRRRIRARGELRASTVRKPRAAPGPHVAFPLLFCRAASVFNTVPSGRRLDPITRGARFLVGNA